MTVLSYSIAPEIFSKYPGYCRAVVLALDVQNGPSPAELVDLLREAEATVITQTSLETIAEHPKIKAWREAYKAFGAKPSEFRSSVEAMARRALRGDQLNSINALVDIGNIVSLRHLVPVGGHAMDDMVHDISLRLARGDEQFIPFGSSEIEHPLNGEVIFVEENTVLTRRWTWRQAHHTLTLPGSRRVEINLDRLPPVELEEIHTCASLVMSLVERFCGGRLRYEILDAGHPRMKLA